MGITIAGITKRFDGFTAVDGVDLDIPTGELIALLGPSGSGKTTLLRIIGGLEFADAGRLLIDGADATATEPYARRVGFVFQHYALFRHMTVFENVAFGLRVARRRPKLAETEISTRVHRLLDLVQLERLADRYPNQLSGGQRQRVALARALATDPKVLLLDEPFGALDAKVRKDLRRWLRGLHREMGITTIFVTHDQEEALELADRVAILHRGRVQQVGTPAEVYDHPATAFVCDFLGSSNRLDCRIEAGRPVRGGRILIDLQVESPDGPASLYVRPQDIEPLPGDGCNAPFCARIVEVRRLGSSLHLDLDLSGDRLEMLLDRWDPAADRLSPGLDLPIRFRHASVFSTA